MISAVQRQGGHRHLGKLSRPVDGEHLWAEAEVRTRGILATHDPSSDPSCPRLFVEVDAPPAEDAPLEWHGPISRSHP